MATMNPQGRLYCQTSTSLGTDLPGDVLAVVLILQATSLAELGLSVFQPPCLSMRCLYFYIGVSDSCR